MSSGVAPVLFLVPLLIVALWFMMWTKKKNRERREGKNNEIPEPIDYELLNEAERIAARQGSLLEQYRDRYVPIGKFSTVQAFSESNMEKVVTELAKIDVDAKYLLIETMPAGAITAFGAAGYYQIWVEPRDEQKTKDFLKQYFGKEF